MGHNGYYNIPLLFYLIIPNNHIKKGVYYRCQLNVIPLHKYLL